MDKFSFLLALLITQLAWSQTLLTGRVTDQKGHALPGANVFIKGSYDGANADSIGAFRFTTTQKDSVLLAVSFIGYEPYSQKLLLNQSAIRVNAVLTEVASELNTVVITAGVFEASDTRRMTMLKPIDVVTIAGGGADITGVMQLMPGTQRVGEQSGLFVRGGSGQESQVVIDGMIVQNPYFSSLPDVQSRGRFQPFMFKGTAFSTGGYSAQYGQALSSVLLLNTADKGTNNGLSISLNLASAALSYDRATEKSSLSGTAYYGNLKPLFALVPQNISWSRVPEYTGTSVTYRLKTGKTGMLKAYGMYSDSWLGMTFRNPGFAGEGLAGSLLNLKLRNRNAFMTSTYTNSWDEANWQLNTGLSYSYDTDHTSYDTANFDRASERVQARAVLTRLLPNNRNAVPNTLLLGGEAHRLTLNNTVAGRPYSLHDNCLALFAESEVYLSRALALRVGIRGEYNSLIDRLNLAPRLSLAFKTGMYSQVSVAAGQFYQMPDYRYLFLNTTLHPERADHLILNYQVINKGRTFRVEGFYKNYAQLVREQTPQYDANPYRYPWGQTNNGGSGYAWGFDLFWRDQKTIKNLDYWVTYSYVDTKRLFQQYTVSATPTFVSDHNLSLITKTYLQKPRLNLSLTYAFTSGRPYYNPNRNAEGSAGFLTDRTPGVHSVSFMASHITTIKGNFTILYAAADNILNSKLIYTYRYTPDGTTRYAVGPQSYRSFFVGAVMMLSKKAKVEPNQL